MTVFDLSLDELRRRQSLKWQAYPPDVLPVWVAEMDCRPAPPVLAALTEAASDGDTGYPIGRSYEQALAEYAAATWDWTFDPVAQAIPVPDVMQGIIAVLDLLGTRGAPVVINPPVYPQFYKYLQWAGRPIIEVQQTAEGRIDLAGLEAAFSGAHGVKPEAYLLCNPQNPQGTAPTREELTAVARLAAEHGVRIVSDEIHAPLVSAPARHTPILAVDGIQDAVIIISASKAWNLAGLKAAVAIGSPDIAPRLVAMPDEVTHSISYLGVRTHVTALTEGQPWLDEVLSEIEANRRLLSSLLAEQLPQVRYLPGDATYLAWLDCRELGLDDPGTTFLDRGRVALNNGLTFGAGGTGHVRMNLATSPEIITEAVRRMAASLD
ncbi:MAG: aminotransferase class I/II-fold pyridoxal phosphate-dependent enzyme [Propionibacteriaceae bacterium]|nr:aminotransferase class I/II-fold pyridoxal phosphate-dependent enzyme [Propionibacteriaceae bacterium]